MGALDSSSGFCSFSERSCLRNRRSMSSCIASSKNIVSLNALSSGLEAAAADEFAWLGDIIPSDEGEAGP